MNKEGYKKLRDAGHFQPLWLELLNASGFAGMNRDGAIVDRRYFPDAVPIQKNTLLGVASPRKIND